MTHPLMRPPSHSSSICVTIHLLTHPSTHESMHLSKHTRFRLDPPTAAVQCPTAPTSLQVKQIVGGELDGGAVPAHVAEGPAAGLHGLPCCVHDCAHELQVAAAQLHLRRHQTLQLFAVLRLVQCQGCWSLGQCPAYPENQKWEKDRL